MPPVERDVLVALPAELCLLGVLSTLRPLSGMAWAVGAAVVIGTAVLLLRALRRSGASELGPANRVTLGRAVAVAAVAALVVEALPGSADPEPLAAIAAVALLLDAVDGRVARRTASVSAVGARFDMELDAVLILVLSLDVAPVVGPWVLALGLARYAFWAGALALPLLRRPTPASRWRKAVAAAQGLALATVAAGLLPPPAALALLICAGLLLTHSFAGQVWWLARHGAPAPPLVAPELEAVPHG